MDKNSFNRKIFHVKTEKSPKSLQLGGSLVLGPKFDIKKYLNNNYQQKSAKKEKIIYPPLFDNLYKRTKLEDKKYELSTIINDNLPSRRNKPLRLKSPSNVSTTLSNNNNSLTINNNRNSSKTLNTINNCSSIKYENIKLKSNNSKKTYLETESKSNSFDIYKSNILDNNNEKFNFSKIIRNIKKFTELSRRDKTAKNILEKKIAYDPKNSDVVFRPIKIINDYQNFQQNQLKRSKEDISAFLTENKEISKNNLIIKILKNQSKDYSKLIYDRQKVFDNNQKVLDSYIENFENMETNQRLSTRKIDDLLTKLVIANRRLLKQKYKLESEVRIKEDERQKILERLDELRIIAKFVTKVLETNLDIFKMKIIPEYSSEKLPNYEIIAKEVFERFDFLLKNEEENLNQEDKNILNQINILNDSELLFRQFHKIEEDIVNILKYKEIIDNEIVVIKKEGIKQNNDIQKRIEDLKNELNLYQSTYEREKREYEEIYKRNYSGDGEFDSLIKDLYNSILNMDTNTNKRRIILNIARAADEIKSIIIEKEQKVNNLQVVLEEYENNDKHLFDRIIYNIKNELKEMKVNMMKQKIEIGEREKLEHLRNPLDKLIFIQRKCEPPYHVPKKEVKIKIDPELIKNLENEELITYE